VTALGGLTWTDVDNPLLVVPIGSCEQHGPHLPLDTDTVIACALADDLAARRGDCVVAPPLAITASGEHQGFAGTLSIGTEVMFAVLVELVRSADWASGVILVNGHGGNVNAVRRAVDVFEQEARAVLVWWPELPGGDPHAGHTETSLMLALAPTSVRFDRAAAGPIPTAPDLLRRGVQPLSESGVLGDPTGADAEHGRALFAELADHLAGSVERWVSGR
jgi:creatinine amidohydrolase